MPLGSDNKEQESQGVKGVASGVTSTVGNLGGGLAKTVGGAVGAVGRGLGDTVNSTTGTQAVGDGLKSATDGVESAGAQVGKGVEDAGNWNKK